jgi:hypothetical protein
MGNSKESFRSGATVPCTLLPGLKALMGMVRNPD